MLPYHPVGLQWVPTYLVMEAPDNRWWRRLKTIARKRINLTLYHIVRLGTPGLYEVLEGWAGRCVGNELGSAPGPAPFKIIDVQRNHVELPRIALRGS